jgi:hypothetical protein
MGVAGFVLGTIAGQFAGAWAYWRIRGTSPAPSDHESSEAAANREFDAAWAAGLVTTVVASAIYIPFGVHTWIGGNGTSWGMSVFLGLCAGVCQGMLFRGRPLRPPPPRSTNSE